MNIASAIIAASDQVHRYPLCRRADDLRGVLERMLDYQPAEPDVGIMASSYEIHEEVTVRVTADCWNEMRREFVPGDSLSVECNGAWNKREGEYGTVTVKATPGAIEPCTDGEAWAIVTFELEIDE